MVAYAAKKLGAKVNLITNKNGIVLSDYILVKDLLKVEDESSKKS